MPFCKSKQIVGFPNWLTTQLPNTPNSSKNLTLKAICGPFKNLLSFYRFFSFCQFFNKLQERTGKDQFSESIQKRMKEIVIWSLESVQNRVETRKNTHEFFGFDFFIDDQYSPWLLEINSSPAMDYSTSITEDMVKEVSEDMVKVLVDFRYASKGHKLEVDTGCFE